MLRVLDDLTGSCMHATDGAMGPVLNFLFDDHSWHIRYLVVEAGSWLSRHSVVIAVTAAERPDWEKKMIHVNLSREQVRHSPDVDSTRPVARQQEMAMRQFYGWPVSLGGNTLEGGFPWLATGREFPADANADPHLRSARDLTGYEVRDPAGPIGRLENFIIDQDSWHIGYLDVRTGDWLHYRSLLLSTQWVESISWARHQVHMKHAGRNPRGD
ncbi:MAG TPA: hypothetical protein VHW09_19895 [Bryobacteraceae bacterium]|nr:hypothetical protein [Bryobacteraceae bacterium]